MHTHAYTRARAHTHTYTYMHASTHARTHPHQTQTDNTDDIILPDCTYYAKGTEEDYFWLVRPTSNILFSQWDTAVPRAP